MARRERYVVGLDVGTSKVAAIVGEMMDDGGLDIIGIGLAESKGIRRGVVNNVDAAAESTLLTTPRRIPFDSARPMPMMSSPPSSMISPTMAATLEVPTSRPTT